MNNDKKSSGSGKTKHRSHYQKLKWLQTTRTLGLWVQCDECNRWRHLPDILDRHQLSKKWFCSMNPDTTKASCLDPEEPLPFSEAEDLIHSEYAAGSLVVVHLPGWPWWPGMVDDCPDTEQYYWLDGFSDIPTYYNVVFFDAKEVTRAWVAPEHLKPYAEGQELLKKSLKIKKYENRLVVAMKQADEAETLPLGERLAKYSFITKYRGSILSPKKVTRRELQKHHDIFKRKYKVDLPSEESDSESLEEDKLNELNRKDDIKDNNPKKIKKCIEKDERNETNTMVSNIETNTLFKTLSLTDDNNNKIKDSLINGTFDEELQYHRIPTPPSDDFDF